METKKFWYNKEYKLNNINQFLYNLIVQDNPAIIDQFTRFDFDGVCPDSKLWRILNLVAEKVGRRNITITDSARSISQHIQIYKKIYKNNWLKKIPWKSRHLPKKGNPYLRAVDFKIKDYSGKHIKELILSILPKNYFIALGIGSNFVHLDVDRDSYKEWTYG